MPKLPNYADSIMGVQKTSCCAEGFYPSTATLHMRKTLYVQMDNRLILRHLLEDDDEVPDVKVETK